MAETASTEPPRTWKAMTHTSVTRSASRMLRVPTLPLHSLRPDSRSSLIPRGTWMWPIFTRVLETRIAGEYS